MKIRMTDSVAFGNVTYARGQTVDLPEDEARRFCDFHWAVPVEAAAEKAVETPVVPPAPEAETEKAVETPAVSGVLPVEPIKPPKAKARGGKRSKR